MEFTEEEISRLEHYVSSTTSNVFVLRNLPEVLKGALFSRYSRTTLGLRTLFLKEFSPESVEKAQSFYDRILDGYGDDSIGELGSAHLAIEQISMLGAKIVEDCRIGGSPLEKSTRYVYFDQKHDGEYLFCREPTLMASRHRDLYLKTCNTLFEIYSQLGKEITVVMQNKFPRSEESSPAAYAAALRARVLDCTRGLLPTATFTNMGVLGNGRFFETMLQKMRAESLGEMQEIGEKIYVELAKEIPSFIRRAELGHRHQTAFQEFRNKMTGGLKKQAKPLPITTGSGVKLVHFDPEAVKKVAASLVFPYVHASLEDIENSLTDENIENILDEAHQYRQNRRHKSPRALENAVFTFEIVADFGVYRDLQRHRMLTQDRQKLSCHLGYYVPEELAASELYHKAMETAKEAYEIIAEEFPEEAQYVVPMAYNIRWYYTINLRALQWLCELRSAPQGHQGYRYVAQEMADQVSRAFPMFARFFKFVDFEGHYALGRLEQEERKERQKALR